MSGTQAGSTAAGGLSPNTARRLAALIAADAQQLEERAQQSGVTAFLGRPVQREKPNERFLQNTLRNLASANKRQEEKAMWAAWQAEQEQQQQPREQRRQQDWHTQPRGAADERRRKGDSLCRSARRDSSRPGDTGRSPCRRHDRSRSRSRSAERCRSSRSRSRSTPGRQRGSQSMERSQHKHTSRERCRSRSRSRSRHRSSPPAGAAETAADASAAGKNGNHTNGDWSEDDGAGDQQLLQWLGNSKSVRGRGSIGPRADVAGPYLPAPEGAEQLQEGVVKGPAKPSWLQGPTEGEARLKPNTAFLRGVLAAQGLAASAGRAGGQAAEPGGPSDSISSGSSSDSGSDSSRWRRSSKKQKRDSSSKRKKYKKHKKSSKRKEKKRSRH